MQVSALRVYMTNCNGRTNSDIYIARLVMVGSKWYNIPTSIRISHVASSEGVLEFRAHEAVAVTRASQDGEMDPEHEHVEQHRDKNKTYRPSDEVLDP